MRKILLFLILLLIASDLWAAPTTYYIKPTATGTEDGLSWTNAWGRAEWETDLESPCEAGDVYVMWGGTYTLSEDLDMTLIDGTAAAPITIVGVVTGTTNTYANLVAADYATGASRPDIVCAANQFGMGDNWVVKNLDFTTDHASGVQFSVYCHVEKVSVVGTGARAINSGNYNRFLDCDAKTAAGSAFYCGGSNKLLRCYAYDSVTGIYFAGDSNVIQGCKIDTCQTGIDINQRNFNFIAGNTIWGSTTRGISGTTGTANLAVNNIIDSCAIGVEWATTPSLSNIFDYNVWANNTDDIVDTDVIWGVHRVESASSIVNATTGQLTSGSVAINAGLQITNAAVTGDKINIGADQDDNTSCGHPPVGPSVVK